MGTGRTGPLSSRVLIESANLGRRTARGGSIRVDTDEPWPGDWTAIEIIAWWQLNHSGGLAPRVGRGRRFHGYPRLRLRDEATGFDLSAQPSTLTVYELPEGDEHVPVVREAIWRRTHDRHQLGHEEERSGSKARLKPTIQIRDAPVPAPAFERLLRRAASFQIPLTWTQEVADFVTDGSAVGFEFSSLDQPPTILHLEWTDRLPESWGPVEAWYRELRALLVTSLAK